MNTFIQSIATSPTYGRALAWGKLLTVVSSTQALMQGIGLVAGISVIRLLPTKEYALYTLANTILGTMFALADGGITTGVMAHGGKVWQDKNNFGIILSTGLDLRKKFAAITLIIITPFLAFLLRNHGASWLTSCLIILTISPVFLATLSGSILEIAPKLKQDIFALQKTQLKASIARLLILCLTLPIVSKSFVAIIAAGIPQIWANKRLREISSSYADLNQVPSPVMRKDILAFVKRIFPYSLYYCLSSQAVLWIVSFFGSTKSIAQIGALGRLTMALSIFTTVFNTLITPRFSKLKENSFQILSFYITSQLGILFSCFLFIGIAYIFPTPILWVLGKNYSNLQVEFLLSITNSCLAMVAGISFALCASRGWIINPVIAIPINIITITCAASLIDVSTLGGALKLSIVIELIQAVMNITYGGIKAIQSLNIQKVQTPSYNL